MPIPQPSSLAPTRIRVLHLLETAQPEGAAIARWVRELARHLDPQRFTMEAWFFGEPGPLVQELEAAGVPSRVLPFPGKNPVALLRAWRELRASNAEIVHLHLWSRTLRWTTAASGKKMLLHLHARTAESGMAAGPQIPTGGADAVVAVSEAVARHASGQRPVVIYPGVEAAGSPAGHHGAQVVGTACRLVPVKALPCLLAAMALVIKRFPNARLEMAGEGAERTALEAESVRLGIADHVRFLGWIREPQDAMRGWSVFAQSSWDEGFPVAALEAMAVGLPIVATAVGGLPELVANGRNGWLVDANDAEALAGRIADLLADPEAARRMGEAGRQEARARFSRQRMAESMAAVYDQLASR